jgi:hypothetical protein
MRRGLLPAAILGLGLCLPAPPATATPLPILKGPVLDLNTSNISGDFSDIVNLDNRTSMGGGLFIIVPLHPELAIQTALLYTGRGASGAHFQNAALSSSGVPTSNALPLPMAVELNYLEAPVLARFTLKTDGKVRPAIFAGPEFSVIISSQATYPTGSGTPSADFNLRLRALPGRRP